MWNTKKTEGKEEDMERNWSLKKSRSNHRQEADETSSDEKIRKDRKTL